jgi:hypothetical protein
MKCPVCNKNNKRGASVCRHCGNKFIVDGEPEFSRNTVGEYKMAVSKKLIYAVAISASAVIVLLIVLLFIPKKKKSGIIIIQRQNESAAPQTRPNTESIERANVETGSVGQTNITGDIEAVVKDYRLRVRESHKTKSRIVGYLPKGAVVKILAKTDVVKIKSKRKYMSGRWYKISWQKEESEGSVKNITGWVWGDYLTLRN